MDTINESKNRSSIGLVGHSVATFTQQLISQLISVSKMLFFSSVRTRR